MKKTVLVMFGGDSTEHEVSCVSATFVINNLDKTKYDIIPLGIDRSGSWFIYNGELAKIEDDSWVNDKESLVPVAGAVRGGVHAFDRQKGLWEFIPVDVVFPVLHGKNGEDGTMQGLLTLCKLPFVGCGMYSSAVCMDKAAAKTLCEAEGIRTAPFETARNTPGFDKEKFIEKCEKRFGYPVFIKPANAGSSVGITKALCRNDFEKGVDLAFANDRKIIVEAMISGKEIEVAVLGNDGPEAPCCGEIAPNADFYDYETKYVTDTSRAYIPARIAPEAAERVRKLAVKIYTALDCAGFARVDFFVDGENIIFNEINTIPGFTSISMYPKMMIYGGRTASGLLDELIALALEAKR
ncbi:MAG: D-alanine--D-alanine ligase [Clostridia bacterium]|nr:D-alanine--D-alanine ligase [Clostridia bacterium]